LKIDQIKRNLWTIPKYFIHLNNWRFLNWHFEPFNDSVNVVQTCDLNDVNYDWNFSDFGTVLRCCFFRYKIGIPGWIKALEKAPLFQSNLNKKFLINPKKPTCFSLISFSPDRASKNHHHLQKIASHYHLLQSHLNLKYGGYEWRKNNPRFSKQTSSSLTNFTQFIKSTLYVIYERISRANLFSLMN
jgi:hypothetical protein